MHEIWRSLRDHVSTLLGIDLDCAQRMGLPHGLGVADKSCSGAARLLLGEASAMEGLKSPTTDLEEGAKPMTSSMIYRGHDIDDEGGKWVVSKKGATLFTANSEEEACDWVNEQKQKEGTEKSGGSK
jgi:hypothetical protein